MKKLALSLAVAATFSSTGALAESSISTVNTGTATTSANLDFTVVIPRVLFLRVGSAGTGAANINNITFSPTAAALGTGILGTPATYTAGAGGDIGSGAVTFRLYGNAGNIALTANTGGFLTTGTAGETIPWSEIVVAPSALLPATTGYTNGTQAPPAFRGTNDSGAGATTTINATNKVVRTEATWTYSYANTAVYAAGTYGGVNANNGRVQYTASTP